MVFDPKYNDFLKDANASPFRHGAKITFIQMIVLIVAFAWGHSITKAAYNAEVHRDTVKDIFGAIRDRLSKPRFKKWVQSEYENPNLTKEQNFDQMSEARDALFHCHENTGCQKRYRARRRQERLCRACPIYGYVQSHVPERERHKSDAENLIFLVDDLKAFYADLGWNESVNSGGTAREIFDKRFRHFEIVSTAIGRSTFDDQGKVISDEDDFLSLHHLAKELTDELRETPLQDS